MRDGRSLGGPPEMSIVILDPLLKIAERRFSLRLRQPS
jgi:hypothetical protein